MRSTGSVGSTPALRELEQLDVAVLDRVALRLERHGAAGEQRVGAALQQLARFFVILIQRRLRVLEDLFAVDVVPDDVAAADFDLGLHPLVAVIGLRRAVGAVVGVELAVVDDVRAGGAQVAGGALMDAVAA
jgi:hypothetical protein